jgi:hypothetical protein
MTGSSPRLACGRSQRLDRGFSPFRAPRARSSISRFSLPLFANRILVAAERIVDTESGTSTLVRESHETEIAGRAETRIATVVAKRSASVPASNANVVNDAEPSERRALVFRGRADQFANIVALGDDERPSI